MRSVYCCVYMCILLIGLYTSGMAQDTAQVVVRTRGHHLDNADTTEFDASEMRGWRGRSTFAVIIDIIRKGDPIGNRVNYPRAVLVQINNVTVAEAELWTKHNLSETVFEIDSITGDTVPVVESQHPFMMDSTLVDSLMEVMRTDSIIIYDRYQLVKKDIKPRGN